MANYASSTLTGAGTGAAIGASVGSAIPVIGTAVGTVAGGIIGAIGGVISAYIEDGDEKKYNENLEDVAREYGTTMDEVKGLVTEYYDKKGTLLDDAGRKEYKDALTSTDWEALGAVNFDKDAYNVNDYYDQNRKQLVQAAQDDALGSANISGSVLGSGAIGQQIGAAVSTENGLADKAFERMQADRNFDYGLAKDTASQRLDAIKSKIASLGEAYTTDTQSEEDYLKTILGLDQAKANAKLTAMMNQV